MPAFSQHTVMQRLYRHMIDTTKSAPEKLSLLEYAIIDACASDTSAVPNLFSEYRNVEKKVNPAFEKYTVGEQQALLFQMRGQVEKARALIDSLSRAVNKKELLAMKVELDYSRSFIIFNSHNESEHPAIDSFYRSSVRLSHDVGNWLMEGSYWVAWSKFRFNEKTKPEYQGKGADIFNFSDSALVIFQRHQMDFLYEKTAISEARFYFLQKNNGKAEELILPILAVAEKIHDTTSLITSYGLLGGIYAEIQNYGESEKNCMKAMALAEKGNNFSSMSSLSHRLSIDYCNEHDTAKTLYYGRKSIVYNDLAGNKYNEPLVMGDYGNVLLAFGFLDSAKYYQKIALDDRIKFNNHEGQLYSYNSLGSLALHEKNFSDAVDYGEKALELENKYHYGIYNDVIYYNLYNGYEGMKNWEKAFLYMKKYHVAKDSLDSLSNKTHIADLQASFEQKRMKEQFDFKQNLSRMENERQEQKSASIRNLLLSGMLAVLVILGFVFRSYRIKNKSNKMLAQKNTEIAQQKEIVEEKQKEILDSIHYAKRIQQSLLPTEKFIDKSLKRLNKK